MSPWISIARVLACISFVVAVIAGFILAGLSSNALQGFIIILASIFGGLLQLAVIMVVTYAAEDIFVIKNKMFETNISHPATQKLCGKCEKEYDADMRSCPHCGNRM